MALNVKSLIVAAIAIIIGLVLFPLIDNQVDIAYQTAHPLNASGTLSAGTYDSTGYQLIPLISTAYILLIIGGAAAYVYFSSKD